MISIVLTWFQIISSIALVALVIMQAKGTGLSGTFGGEGMFYRSKRGVERLLFRGTIISAVVLFIASLILVLVTSKS